MTLVSALLFSALVRANPAVLTSKDVDAKYSACIAEGKSQAACLDAWLPQLQASYGAVTKRLLDVLNADAESRDTAQLLQASLTAYPPSRDADCRLQTKVTEGDEASFRDCVFQLDKERLRRYELFLGFVNEE